MIDVDGYALDGEIGRGGFGTVFRATDHVHGRQVALKVLDRFEDDAARRRFDRERRAMGTLSGHPNIAVVYNSGFTADQRPFIAMELLPGGSLADMLTERGPVDVSEVVAIGVQLCDALAHAHAGGVLHLDMKPENVLFSEFGAVKVVDFGIAALVDDKRSTTIFATPAFADPLVLDGHEGTESSDVYGVAATLFTLTTGTTPYASESGGLSTFHKIANDPVPRVDRHDVPERLADLLHRAMSKDTAGRPESMASLRASLAASLEPAAPSTAIVAPATSSDPPIPSRTRAASEGDSSAAGLAFGNRSSMIAVAVAAVAVAAVAGLIAVLAVTRGGDDSVEAGPSVTDRVESDPEIESGADEATPPSTSDPEVDATTASDPDSDTPAATTLTPATSVTPVSPAPPPRRPPPDGPTASDARFSLQTADGLPDPEVFVVPTGATSLCLTWAYAGFDPGAPYTMGWLIDGVPDAGSGDSGTNQGAATGQFFGCITNGDGLRDGLYEATWAVGGRQVFAHGIHVGGARSPVDIGIQNDRSDALCGVHWVPRGSSTIGIPANPVPIPAGGSFRTTIPAGRYRTVVRNCDGQIVFEDLDTDFQSRDTLTVTN